MQRAVSGTLNFWSGLSICDNNVQHIESLCDTVIKHKKLLYKGIGLFDNAGHQVELMNIEPQDLINV